MIFPTWKWWAVLFWCWHDWIATSVLRDWCSLDTAIKACPLLCIFIQVVQHSGDRDTVSLLQSNCFKLASSLCNYSKDKMAQIAGAGYFVLSGRPIAEVVEHITTSYPDESVRNPYQILMMYLGIVLLSDDYAPQHHDEVSAIVNHTEIMLYLYMWIITDLPGTTLAISSKRAFRHNLKHVEAGSSCSFSIQRRYMCDVMYTTAQKHVLWTVCWQLPFTCSCCLRLYKCTIEGHTTPSSWVFIANMLSTIVKPGSK